MAPLICLLQVLFILATSSTIIAVAQLELTLTCPDNTTKGELISRNTSAGTVVGVVNINLVAATVRGIQTGDFGSLYLNTSGSYFLPSPVDGILRHISLFGLIEEEILLLELGVEDITEAFDQPIPTKLQRNAYIYAVVYGLSSNGMEYNLLSGPTLITQALSAVTVNLDVTVRKGDLIGLLLPSVCLDNMTTITLCPLRPNLPSRDKNCSSAFFHPMDSAELVLDRISISEFTEVLVNLSMAVEIIPLPSIAGNGRVTLGVGITVAVIIISGVVVTSILVAMKFRSVKKSKSKASKSADERDYAESISLSTPDTVHLGENHGSPTSTEGDDSTQIHSGLVKNLSQFNLVIPSAHITLMDTIGQGEFGVVYKGHLAEWQGRTAPELVAVKTLKSKEPLAMTQ